MKKKFLRLKLRSKITILLLVLLLIGGSVGAFFYIKHRMGQAQEQTPAEEEPKYVEGEAIVSFKNKMNPSDILNNRRYRDQFKIKEAKKLFNLSKEKFSKSETIRQKEEALDKIYLLKTIEETKSLVSKLKHDPDVEFAEPNFFLKTAETIPNDPYWSNDLYGLKKINTQQAWDVTTGNSNIVVAVIDSGVDRTHEDIAQNIWNNPGEIPNNGIDDDGNGYIDDTWGWDFVNNDNDPTDIDGHGTHCAGTISAVGNNGIGIVGVNWNVKIMPIKFIDVQTGTDANAISSIYYAISNGASVLSNSWGGSQYSYYLHQAIEDVHLQNRIFIAAAGNANKNIREFYPASDPLAITVGASDYQDQKASFSNYGNIDVVAPGVDIISLRAKNTSMGSVLNDKYTMASGTSMAAPHVAGLAALLLSHNNFLKNEEIRQIIRKSIDDIGNPGFDQYFGYGRINAAKAINETKRGVALIKSPMDSETIFTRNITISGQAYSANFKKYRLDWGEGILPGTWNTIIESNNQVYDGFITTIDSTIFPDGLISLRLTVEDNDGFIFEDRNVPLFDHVRITSPTLNSTFPQGLVTIEGSALGPNFQNYSLEYKSGIDNNWTEIVNSTAPVEEGLLAEWFTGGLPSSSYYIRLTVNSTDGRKSQEMTKIVIDNTLHQGWPKHYPSWGNEEVITPSFADLNNDGKSEVIVSFHIEEGGLDLNRLFIFNDRGEKIIGLPPYQQWPGGRYYDPSFADMDNDGFLEIIIADEFKVHIFNYNGTEIPGWPQDRDLGFDDYHWFGGTPAIGDIDGDGQLEIAIQAAGSSLEQPSRIYVWNQDGSNQTGFPRKLDGSVKYYIEEMRPSITLADLNKDGFLEMIFGSYDGKVYVMDYLGQIPAGTQWPLKLTDIIPGWTISYEIASTPAINFKGSDGYPEIVVTTGDSKLYLLDRNGNIKNGWPQITPQGYNVVTESPVLADLDGDGKVEIVTNYSTGLKIWRLNGTLFKELNLTWAWGRGSPILADVNNDKIAEIFFNCLTNRGGAWEMMSFFVFGTDKNLNYLTGFPKPLIDWINNSIYMSDIDNDGYYEISASSDHFILATLEQDDYAYIWDTTLPVGSQKFPWPKFQRDIYNSGNYDVTLPTVSITAPTEGEVVKSGFISVIRAIAGDNVKVAKVEFYVDGVLQCTDYTGAYTCDWRVPSDTKHVLQAKAYDIAGNRGDSQIINVNTGDTTSPTVSITAPSNGAIVPTGSKLIIRASATDNVRVTKIEFYVSGVLKCTDTTAPHNCSWTVPGDIKGTKYQLQAKAYDAAGNIGSSAIINLTHK